MDSVFATSNAQFPALSLIFNASSMSGKDAPAKAVLYIDTSGRVRSRNSPECLHPPRRELLCRVRSRSVIARGPESAGNQHHQSQAGTSVSTPLFFSPPRPNPCLPLRHLDTDMQRSVARGCEHIDVRLVLHEQLDAFAVAVSARFMQRGHSFSRRIVYQFVVFLIVDDVGARLCDRRQNGRHRLCLPCSHEASYVILVVSTPFASRTHAACLHSPPDAKRSLATTRLAHPQRPCAHKVVPLHPRDGITVSGCGPAVINFDFEITYCFRSRLLGACSHVQRGMAHGIRFVDVASLLHKPKDLCDVLCCSDSVPFLPFACSSVPPSHSGRARSWPDKEHSA